MSKCNDPDFGNLLHAYELNALSEEDTERFETHLLQCEHCFNQLKSFEQEVALLSSDDEVKEIIREAAMEEYPQSESFLRRLWRYIWPETPLVFKPALPYLLILLLIIPAYHGVVMLTKKENVNTENILLAGGERGSTEAEARTIEVKPQTQYMLLVPLEKQIRGDTLRLTMELTDGTPIWQQDVIATPGPDRMVSFTLLQSKLRTEIYRLVIYDYRTNEDQQRYLRIVKR